MPASEILLLLGVMVFAPVGLWILFFLVRKEIRELKESKTEEKLALLIKQDIEAMRKNFDEGYRQMAREFGMVQEIGRTMKDFQDFLKSPKLRGNLGEQILRDLLEQILPKKHFDLQHQFREGQMVDAIIKTKQGDIPIDSKFPTEHFRRLQQSSSENHEVLGKEFSRDIKKHIDDIAKKYILPQEGTVDFALMYVPSEPIYYEIMLHHPDLVEYGYQKKVMPVSPNNFYYFLKIIMLGLEAAKVEDAAKKILSGLKAIQQEASKFGDEFSVLTSHIEHARGAADRAQSRYGKLVGKIDHLGSLEAPEEKKQLQ